jgi:hypothetical protein
MKQSSLDLNLSTKKTRKQELLAQMDLVVPWAALVELIPVLPRRQERSPTLCTGDHAAHPLHAAVVHPVRSGDGRSLL